jgi:hypothetical protein
MTQHPDLAQEQAYVDRAYECLERTRQDAWKLRRLTEAGLGGTFQARYERDVFDEAIVSRLTQLDLGEAALVFGRIPEIAISLQLMEHPCRRRTQGHPVEQAIDGPVISLHAGARRVTR